MIIIQLDHSHPIPEFGEYWYEIHWSLVPKPITTPMLVDWLKERGYPIPARIWRWKSGSFIIPGAPEIT
mgnify:CR=1 FL=1